MIKIVLIVLISGILCFYLKNVNSEIFSICLIASGLLIFFETFSYLSTTFDFIKELIDVSEIDRQIIKIVVKITLIGILVELSASLLNDFGLNSLSIKTILIGKIIIISTAIPIFYEVFNILKNLLEI